jgi:glycosyltransferase involved in cell wall biosynthesis
MLVWLVQRAEPTPIDNNGKQRLMRTGIFAKVLAAENHEVVWWTSSYDHHNHCHRFDNDKRVVVGDGYEIQFLKSSGYKKNISLARLKDNINLAKRFKTIADKEQKKPDIIIASVPTAELALEATQYGKKYNIPVILDVRDLWPDVLKAHVPWWARPFANLILLPMTLATKQAFSNADSVIGITKEFVEWGLRYGDRRLSANDLAFGMGYLKRKLLDDEQDKGKMFWESAGLMPYDNKLKIVFFGTLGHMFDFNPIIEAAKILDTKNSQVQIIICGDGESSSLIKEEVKNLSNIIMPGWIGDLEIRTLIEYADIGLAPYIDCLNFTNNIANKPAEYLSGGLPIALSFNHGVLFNLLEKNHCGFSYQNNGVMLADFIQLYCDNRSLLKELSDNSYHVFRTYLDGDVIYRSMIDYCEKLAVK